MLAVPKYDLISPEQYDQEQIARRYDNRAVKQKRRGKERDNKAEKAIKKLEQQYDNFCLKRLGDTHAKILISDSKFAVVTSFNWLSFKGDPNRTFRDERGILVSESQKIKELFDNEMESFELGIRS
ncbi:MAG: hypothetical protein RLO19_01020 [Coleofasciculus sp. G2-EDA-02]